MSETPTASESVLLDLLRAGIAAADPAAAVRRNAPLIEEALHDERIEKIAIVAAGKGASAMARAALEVRGPRPVEGVVVIPRGLSPGPGTLEPLELIEGSHPLPDAGSLAAAAAVGRLLDRAQERTLVLALLSGGASSLLAAPIEGLTTEDLARTTSAMLRAGVPIAEMNAVRKHLSRLGGGRLAARAFPARTLAFVVSDVPGDRLDVIASGPATPDPSTWAEALGVIESRGLLQELPLEVQRTLLAGAAGQRDETPKPGDPRLARARAMLVLRAVDAAEAIARRAGELGYETELLGEVLHGDARACGLDLAERALSSRRDRRCRIGWGETTVAVQGPGRGGRTLECALGAALALDGTRGISLLTASTDGIDGTSGATGAIVDGATLARARALGLDAAHSFATNDTLPYFERAGGLVVLGPTGTNVMDVVVILED